MVDFACDQDGSPILAVSSLAVHSKNLSGNPKCSLLVAKDPEDRTDTVITIYGDAVPVIPSLPCLSTLISCLSLLHFSSDILLNA